MKFFSSDDILTDLANAILEEDINSLEYAIKKGFNISQPFIIFRHVQTTPIELALSENKLVVVNWLLSNKVNLNVKGHSPIVIASSNCSQDTIALLLANGANINAKQYTGLTAMEASLYEERNELIPFLIDNGYEIFKDGSSLRQAVSAKNKKAVDIFLGYNVDVNLHAADMVYPYNPTAVAEAVRNEDFETVKLLVDHGADLTIKDNYGERPFNIAVKKQNKQIADFIKSLEPAQWHNEEQKIEELKAYKMPDELLDILRAKQRRIEIKGQDKVKYIEFSSLLEVKEVKWQKHKFLDLLSNVDNYSEEGFLVWYPKKKCLAFADYEHSTFIELSGMKEFLENPAKQIDKIFSPSEE